MSDLNLPKAALLAAPYLETIRRQMDEKETGQFSPESVASSALKPPKIPDLRTLADALSVSIEAEGSERDVARTSLFWTLVYLDEQGIGTDLTGPLWALLFELGDLDEGKTGPITSRGNGRQLRPADATGRAIALAVLEHLEGCLGMSQPDALARLRRECGLHCTRDNVNSWIRNRDRLRRPPRAGKLNKLGFALEDYDQATERLLSDPEALAILLQKLRHLGFQQQTRQSHGPRAAPGSNKPPAGLAPRLMK